MLNIKALIFDLDGVIIDSLELHYHAWKNLADEEGLSFTRQDNEYLRGLTREDSLKYILHEREIDPQTTQIWLERKNNFFLKELHHLNSGHTLPGVKDLIVEAKTAGLKIGLGSSSKNAHAVIKQVGLVDFFDSICDGQAVLHPKPAPDIFQLVAQQLGVCPSEAIVFEDSKVGIQAALSGGFWTVGLGKDQVSNAHLILPDLAGVSVNRLIHYFSKQVL